MPAGRGTAFNICDKRCFLITHLDHLVVTAPTLLDGANLVERLLGVRPQPGGMHPRMGTHNLLLKLGKDIYLEVIAIDPDAPAPGRPRWFGLDSDTSARLATWVARTGDIASATRSLRSGAGFSEPGNIEPMTRGELQWQITIPQSGRLPLQGVAPALIQWGSGPHPASRLNDSGCSLHTLQLFHPHASQLCHALSLCGFEGPVEFIDIAEGETPHLSASIDTPTGLRTF